MSYKRTENGEWICPSCKKAFKTRDLLISHRKKNKCYTAGNNLVTAKEGGWNCACGKNFRTRAELQKHRKECVLYKNTKGQLHQKKIMTCIFCGKTWLVNKEGLHNHERTCKKNPNRVAHIGFTPSEETKKKISESMKKAHKEGRAHNIGECRWNNKASYPERWFMKMIKNEFNLKCNKDYLKEFPFHKYSLDFAWPDQKFCIEIDGEQHQRFQEQKERDLEKDRLLKEEGWSELRVDWSWICNNSKNFIYSLKKIFNGDNKKISDINFSSKEYIKNKEEEKLIHESLPKDSLGRHNKSILSTEELEQRKQAILMSGVDINKFGWVSKVSKITNLSKHQIENVVNKTNIKCFRRK